MPSTECKENIMKEKLYEEVTEIYDSASRNTVRIKDFNVKIGKEPSFRPTIGLHRAHKQSSENVQNGCNLKEYNRK